jgi:hypothetical protein
MEKISTTPRKKAKTTLKGMGNITKAESWSDLELMGIREQMRDVQTVLIHRDFEAIETLDPPSQFLV